MNKGNFENVLLMVLDIACRRTMVY